MQTAVNDRLDGEKEKKKFRAFVQENENSLKF